MIVFVIIGLSGFVGSELFSESEKILARVGDKVFALNFYLGRLCLWLTFGQSHQFALPQEFSPAGSSFSLSTFLPREKDMNPSDSKWLS